MFPSHPLFKFLFQQTNVVFVHQKYYKLTNRILYIRFFFLFIINLIELNIPAFMYHLRNVFNGGHNNMNKIIFISLFYQFIYDFDVINWFIKSLKPFQF